MTTKDLHGRERRSAPPALPPLICMVIPDYSSFSVLRETPMTVAWSHFKNLKCYILLIFLLREKTVVYMVQHTIDESS
jgi:hypothetical protein